MLIHLPDRDLSDIHLCVCVDGQKQISDAGRENAFVFEIENPKLWNAEEPYTYEMTIELSDGDKVTEVHSKKFGFAEYIVKGNKLLLNNRQITLKGINRHEHDPENGRAITVERIEKELKMLMDAMSRYKESK